jgi:hypothetical protein
MEKQGDRYFPPPHGTESLQERSQRIERGILLAQAEMAISALEVYDAAAKAVDDSQGKLQETFRETSQEVTQSLSETEREIIDRALRPIYHFN